MIGDTAFVSELEALGKKFKYNELTGNYCFDIEINGAQFAWLQSRENIIKLVNRAIENFGVSTSTLQHVELFDNASVLLKELQPSDFKVRLFGGVPKNKYNSDYCLAPYELRWQINDFQTPFQKAWDRIIADIKIEPFSELGGITEKRVALENISLKDIATRMGKLCWVFENNSAISNILSFFQEAHYIARNVGEIAFEGPTCYVTSAPSGFAFDNGDCRVTFFLKPGSSGMHGEKPDCYIGVYYNRIKTYYVRELEYK